MFSGIENRNFYWQEISVGKGDFQKVCAAAEVETWAELNDVKQFDIDMSYFCVRCICVPDRKVLAFVTRTNLALTDVFSPALFLRDLERALAGEIIRREPLF
jgi:hypothetical protein